METLPMEIWLRSLARAAGVEEPAIATAGRRPATARARRHRADPAGGVIPGGPPAERRPEPSPPPAGRGPFMRAEP